MRLIIYNVHNENLKPFIEDIIIPCCSQILYSIIDRKYLKKLELTKQVEELENVKENI